MRVFDHEIKINDQSVMLHAYLPTTPEVAQYTVRPAVIVLPGGAYLRTAAHEGEPIALQYVAAGMCAFVLNYSVFPARFPQSLLEALHAVRYVREHAEEFGIDPNAISVCGFSAGGHLAASAGTLWSHACLDGMLEGDRRQYRPDSLILCYPVIGNDTHHRSMLNLFENQEEELTPERLQLLQLDEQVREDTPPTFLWHNATDAGVPCTGSLHFAEALYRHSVTCELHLYSEGKHGCGLGNHLTCKREYRDEMVCGSWMRLSIDFLYRLLENKE